MGNKVAITYNDPAVSFRESGSEDMAVAGVMDAVGAVHEALSTTGCFVSLHALRPPMSAIRQEIRALRADIVFNLFEGFEGLQTSESDVAAMMEQEGLCFTGSPASALRLCQDKSRVKSVLRSHDIPTPDWQVLSPTGLPSFNLPFPCIVKPIGEHASHGIYETSVVSDLASLEQQVRWIEQAYHRPSLVEQFLPGREFCALILGDGNPRVFPIEEIVYELPPDKPRILCYPAKWAPEDRYYEATRPVCPARIEPDMARRIEVLALEAFESVGCRDYARVDMRQDEAGNPLVIDVNPNPDLSPQGGARLQAEAGDLDYTSFINCILSFARERGRREVTHGNMP